MAEFDKAIAWVLQHEGGFSDSKNDPGGATNFGISLRYLRESGRLAKWGAIADPAAAHSIIAGLTRAEAIAIYRADWWDKYHYSDIGEQVMATKVLDLAVNMGAHEAHTLLQRALCSCGYSLTIDGILGKRTLNAVNDRPRGLMAALCAAATDFYTLLASMHPEEAGFLPGWIRRANDIPEKPMETPQAPAVSEAAPAPVPIPAPVAAGQAIVNSHTFWGALTGYVTAVGPVAAEIAATHAASPTQIGLIATATGALVWTIIGRIRASKPITGLLKAAG